MKPYCGCCHGGHVEFGGDVEFMCAECWTHRGINDYLRDKISELANIRIANDQEHQETHSAAKAHKWETAPKP